MKRRDVALLPLELVRWDQARPGDLLIAPVLEDVRPLRGAAGLADWRLQGSLSRSLREGAFAGALGETYVLDSGGKLPWKRLLAIGAGASETLDEARVRRVLDAALAWAHQADLSRLALAVPGRETGRLDPARAGVVLAAALAVVPVRELTVIDQGPALRPLTAALPDG